MEKVEQDFVILPGGVHLWGPEPEYLGGVPDEIIAKESAGHTLHLLETPGWRTLESKTVLVTGDVPDEALRMIAVTAEELNKMLFMQIGGEPKAQRYKVRIFARRKDFCSFAAICGASSALSLYDPRTQEMALHFGDDTDREDFESTFGHEFTHAYMDMVFGVTGPLWFAEGMAEYFSRVKWTTRGYRPTGKNWRAMMVLDTPDLISLMDLLRASRSDMYGVNFPQYYAQVWVLVHFLMKKHPEAIESLLMKRPVHLELDREYVNYLKRLRGD